MELQMNLVQQVMSLGGGSAGFYTPRFEGREMKLQTFCLGRHWASRLTSHGSAPKATRHDDKQTILDHLRAIPGKQPSFLV